MPVTPSKRKELDFCTCRKPRKINGALKLMFCMSMSACHARDSLAEIVLVE